MAGIPVDSVLQIEIKEVSNPVAR